MKEFGWQADINLSMCLKNRLDKMVRVKEYLTEVVKQIDMLPYGPPIVHRFGEGTLEGVTGLQLIYTSSIVVHCDEPGRRVFITCFSCKKFDADMLRDFSIEFFKAKQSTMAYGSR